MEVDKMSSCTQPNDVDGSIEEYATDSAVPGLFSLVFWLFVFVLCSS